MKSSSFLISVICLFVHACYTATEKGIQCGSGNCGDACDAVQDAALELETAEEGGEIIVTSGTVGDPCKVNEECDTDFCLTTTFLEYMGLVIPGLDPEWGICSKMSCIEDSECGAGGKCFDTQPFTGSPIKLCLRSCEEMFDCRYTAGESCFGDETEKACLPDAVIAAIVCGDGTCDINEKLTGSCPDDCK